jgi:hypothetical protein
MNVGGKYMRRGRRTNLRRGRTVRQTIQGSRTHESGTGGGVQSGGVQRRRSAERRSANLK